MREERWMLTDELFLPTRPEPPEVAAFRLLQEEDWSKFMTDVIDNPALKFFNPEIPEFDSADSWEKLSDNYGVAPFSDELSIPAGLPDNVHDFCRDLRSVMRQREEEYCAGCKAFYSPAEWNVPLHRAVQLVVCHDGGYVANRFNVSYGCVRDYRQVDHLLAARGLYREHESACVTYIFRA